MLDFRLENETMLKFSKEAGEQERCRDESTRLRLVCGLGSIPGLYLHSTFFKKFLVLQGGAITQDF